MVSKLTCHKDYSKVIYLNRIHFTYQKNSAELIRNIIGEVGLLSTVLQSILMILTEGMVFLGLLALLMFIQPQGALLVITIFGIVGFGFYGALRNHILRWGELRQKHEGLRLLHLQQALGGLKDIKILGREQEFIKNFNLHNSSSAHVNKMQMTFMAIPRFLLELLAILSLVALVVLMIKNGTTMGELVPVLGVFAASAFRLMPSVNRLLNAYQNLRYSMPVVETIYSELKYTKCSDLSENQAGLHFFNKINLKNINYSYPGSDDLALVNISMEIPHGSTVGIIGPSGAGKSTLVDVILGLLIPQNGEVVADEVDIKKNMRAWQNKIGYVPQSIYLTDDTLERNITLGLPQEQIDNEKIKNAVESAQLKSFVENCADGLNTIVGERGVRISGGQKQRIGIARALYHDPEVLILDEATSSLDTSTEADVMRAVTKLHGKKTIIIIAHRLSTVKDCDYLYKLDDGRVINQGYPEDLLAVNN